MATQNGDPRNDSTGPAPKLTEYLQRVIEAACREAQQRKLAETPFMREEWLRLGERDFHGWEMATSLRPNCAQLAGLACVSATVLQVTDEIIELCKSHELLKNNVMRTVDGQPVRDSRRFERMHLENLVTVPLVAMYFERVGGFQYAREVAEDLASQSVAALMAADAPACRLSPLVNMRLIASEYQVEPGLKVRALAPEDIEVWLNREYSAWSAGDRPTPINQLNRLWCAVEVEYRRPFFNPENADEAARERADEVLSALRLAAEGDTHPAFHDKQVRDRLRPFMFVERQPSIVFGDQPFYAGPLTMIHFRRIRRAMRTSPNAAAAAVALRRWSSATERTRPDDRLLDYWIGLECLLLGRRDAKQRTAAVRGAVLLTSDPAGRATIADQLYDSYDCRSAIMHGDTQGLARYDIAQEAATTRQLLKRCLLTILDGPVFNPTLLKDAALDKRLRQHGTARNPKP